jgi:hypothetical protein
MSKKYQCIAEVAVGAGGSSTITFNSIPGTYADLCLVISARTSYADNNEQIKIQYNNDSTSTNYHDNILYAFGTTVGAANRTGNGASQDFNVNAANSTSNLFSNNQLYISSYTSSEYKAFGYEVTNEKNSSGGNLLVLDAGIWKSTSAVTSIKLSTVQSGSVFVQHSTAALYGIKNS